jgi:hypothetical protein
MTLRSEKVIFSLSKKLWTKNTLRADSTIFLQHPHILVLQIMEYQNLIVPWAAVEGSMQSFPSFHSFVTQGIPRALV